MSILVATVSVLFGTSHVQNATGRQRPKLIELAPKTYALAKPMEIGGDESVLDGHGATLRGSGSGAGLHIGAYAHVTVKNLKILGFATGLSAQGATSLTLQNVSVSGAGGGIRLKKVTGGLLQGIETHACATGVQFVSCSKLVLEKSDLSQNVRCGLSLSESASCIVRDNKINSIGGGAGSSVSDAGILIENASDHNQILRNVVAHCKPFGIAMTSANGGPSTDNMIQGNDVSWAESGVGIAISGEAKNNLVDNCVGHCQTGIQLQNATNTLIRGNFVVGNTTAGIDDEFGSLNRYERNVLGQDTGGPVALILKGKAGVECNTRLYQNIFLDYLKPLVIDNASPATLQSNTFSNSATLELTDLAAITGPAPFFLDNNNDRSVSGPFVPSAGPLAVAPSIYDTVSGVSVSAMQKEGDEVVVEGSLSGAFQGEQEVLAQYKGGLPVEITFPKRIVAQVRIRGVIQTRASFLLLLGDHSMAHNMPADDSGDTLIVPGLAVDGDTTTPDHFWKAPTGNSGEWWAVNLRGDRAITAFAVLPNPAHPDHFWGKFHIAVSTTGLFRGEETTVATETNFAKKPAGLHIYHVPPTTARYVRLIGDEDKNPVEMQQFFVYGTSQ